MLTWNLGSGPRRIFTEKPIEFKENTARTSININVGRLGRRAWLSVDGKNNASGRSPGNLDKMDVVPILYLGGHEVSNFSTLPHDIPLHMGFQGCIFDVHFKAGMVVIPLQETRGVQGRGVGQCGKFLIYSSQIVDLVTVDQLNFQGRKNAIVMHARMEVLASIMGQRFRAFVKKVSTDLFVHKEAIHATKATINALLDRPVLCW